MTKRLKTIAPLQLGKMLALIYGLGSLVLVPFLLLLTLLASFAPNTSSTSTPAIMGMGISFIIFAPLLYAGLGFVTGLLGAVIYNVVAKWIGGIEVEVE